MSHPPRQITLAIDTVGEPGSFGVFDGSQPLYFSQVWPPKQVLAQMGAFFEVALGKGGSARGEVAKVAVAVGPGSFSGSRIGVAGAKALAWALGVDVLVFDHQEALAGQAGAYPAETIVSVGDARRGQVHYLHWQGPGYFSQTMDRADALARLGNLGAATLVGDVSGLGDELGALLDVRVAGSESAVLRARGWAAYLSQLSDVRSPIVPASVEVRYVRPYEARANFGTKHSV